MKYKSRLALVAFMWFALATFYEAAVNGVGCSGHIIAHILAVIALLFFVALAEEE